MKFKSVAPKTLHQLHDDCLLEIFKYLNLREQYYLWQLDGQFKNVMLILWKRKYRRAIDFHKESQLKLLTNEECQELLGMILSGTKEITADEFIGHQINELKQETFSNISKISINAKRLTKPPRMKQSQSKCMAHIAEVFPQLESLHLKNWRISLNQLTTLSNLNDLRLLLCPTPSNSGDFEGIFRNLRLKTFAFMASDSGSTSTHTNSQPHFSLQSIKYCTTLQILQIHANDLVAALTEVIQLPRLQQLTIFTTGTNTTHSNMTAAQLNIVAALRNMKAAQIVGVHFSCHLDWRILQQLHSLPNLRTFCWRSHLQVDYIDDGHIKWQSYDPQVSREVLKMVAACRNLKELDLRGNCHVTKEFICCVWKALQVRPDESDEVQLKFDQVEARCDGKKHTSDVDSCKASGYLEFQFENFID